MPAHHSANRSFGFVMFSALGLIFAWRAWRHDQILLPLAAAALVFLLAAMLVPRWLDRPRRLWAALGKYMSYFTQPLILGAIFYLVLTPFGLVRRMLKSGDDQLNSDTYWIKKPREINENDLLRQY